MFAVSGHPLWITRFLFKYTRRYSLRRGGGKMHPAGSDGKMVLSSGAVSARPRLPALIAPDPEPRYGGGQVEEALWIGPGIIPNKCHPCLFTI
jgi:hypothetical protein